MLRSPCPYTELFNDRFPYYLSIGMTPEQYWDEDGMLAYYYRKAEELKVQKENHLAWLQGMYVYDALLRVSPILRAFAKKGTKPEPYVEEPYPISNSDAKQAEEKKEKAKMEKAKRFMESFAVKTNIAMEERGADVGGH